MSFLDLTPQSRFRTPSPTRDFPRGIAQAPSDEAPSPGLRRHGHYNKPWILHGHGRTTRNEEDIVQPHLSLLFSGREPPEPSYQDENLYQINYQLHEFNKLVKELDRCLEDKTPEAKWRGKILVRTTKETATELVRTLRNYHDDAVTVGDRKTHEACLKLQEEWSRINTHLSLVLNKKTRTTVGKNDVYHYDDGTDYFDRVSRQSDIERVKDKMCIVQDIYNDLAVLVDQQQEQIDQLSDNVVDAKLTTEAAADEVACFSAREEFQNNTCGILDLEGHNEITLDEGEKQNTLFGAWLEQIECSSLQPKCGWTEDNVNYEVEISCENDNAIEIQCVEPPSETTNYRAQKTSLHWLPGWQAIQSEVIHWTDWLSLIADRA